MARKLKVGDKVKCIDEDIGLDSNKEYIVSYENTYSKIGQVIQLEGECADCGLKYMFFANKFEKIVDRPIAVTFSVDSPDVDLSVRTTVSKIELIEILEILNRRT